MLRLAERWHRRHSQDPLDEPSDLYESDGCDRDGDGTWHTTARGAAGNGLGRGRDPAGKLARAVGTGLFLVAVVFNEFTYVSLGLFFT